MQPEAGRWFDREWDNLRAAHTWAITSNELDAAETIVTASGPHAHIRRKREHGDWAERTTGLSTGQRQQRPTVYGWAAYWSYADGDTPHAIDSRRGIEVAPAPTHPDTTRCWMLLAHAHMAEGHPIESRRAARSAAGGRIGSAGPLLAGGALQALVNSNFRTRRYGGGGRRQAIRCVGGGGWGPVDAGRGGLLRRPDKAVDPRPSRSNRCTGVLRRGRGTGHVSGDLTHENLTWWRSCSPRRSRGTSPAQELLHDTLVRLWQCHDRLQLGIALVPIASWLESVGEHRRVFQRCRLRPPQRARPRSGHSMVDSMHCGGPEDPRCPSLDARGRSMDQDDVIEFVLEHIVNAGVDVERTLATGGRGALRPPAVALASRRSSEVRRHPTGRRPR